MIINVQNLRKIYKNGEIEVEALKNVSFSICKNEFVSIMGPSGSGKSTLLNILGCLDRISDGVYELDGVDVSKLSDAELAEIRNRKIGFVFQSFNLLPRLTALSNVELPMLYAKVYPAERRKKAIEALKKVGLIERINHKSYELSGGQKQRVAIARALVNKPAVILADEPTGNLDSASGEDIMAIFQELNREGVSIILVTHELEIANHTRRIINFKDGILSNDTLVKNIISANEIIKMREAKNL
mgnify:CR=1 FL=1